MNDEPVSEINGAREAPAFQTVGRPVDVSAKHIRDLIGAGYNGLVDYGLGLYLPTDRKPRSKERHLLCELALCNCRTAISLVEAGVTDQKVLNSIFRSGSIFLVALQPYEWLGAWSVLEQHPVVRRNLDWRLQLLFGLFEISPNRAEIFEFILSLEKLGFKLESDHVIYREVFVRSVFLGRGRKDELPTFAKMVLDAEWEATSKKQKKLLLKVVQQILNSQV